MCICVWEVCGRVSFCCEVFPVLSVKEKHPGEVTGEKAPHAHTLMHLLHRRPAFPSSRSLHTQMDDVIRRLGGERKMGACKRSFRVVICIYTGKLPCKLFAALSASWILTVTWSKCLFLLPPSGLYLEEVLIMVPCPMWLTHWSLHRHRG